MGSSKAKFRSDSVAEIVRSKDLNERQIKYQETSKFQKNSSLLKFAETEEHEDPFLKQIKA